MPYEEERRLIKNRVIRFVKVSVMKDTSREKKARRKETITSNAPLLWLDKLAQDETRQTAIATRKVMTKS